MGTVYSYSASLNKLSSEPAQGTRSDLISLYDDIKHGVKVIDMLNKDPKVSKFEKQIRFMQFQLNEFKSDRQATGVKVYVLYGDPGTGKTFSAINTFGKSGDYFKLDCTSTKYGSLWFDGYEGQKVLVLDDFDEGVCSVSFLKNLLDKYKLRLQVKGGHTWAAWDTVVITSNQHPRIWWQGLTDTNIAALKRRITCIRHYTAMGVYQQVDWEDSKIGPIIDEKVMPKAPADPVIIALDTPPIIISDDLYDIADAPTDPIIYGTSPPLTPLDTLDDLEPYINQGNHF